MITLILLGVGDTEIGQCIFEGSAFAHVAGQHHRVARTGMCPRQHPAAQAGVSLSD